MVSKWFLKVVFCHWLSHLSLEWQGLLWREEDMKTRECF
uniref:Uncharacterized protein n=1 Tax=Picea sitchensis TaxID=3332 RepID=A9NWU6_PICSI|nr:unknown [Picea sitchensis]